MRRTPSVWSGHLPDDSFCPDFPENSMVEFLEERAGQALRRTAVEFEGRKISYQALFKQIDEIAAALRFHGIDRGDIVSIVSPNIPQAVATVYAVNKIGAIANMLHPLLPAAELRDHIENTQSRAVFILDSLYTKIENTGWKMDPPWIILYSVRDALDFPKKLFVRRARRSRHLPQHPHRKDCVDRVLVWKRFLKSCADGPDSCRKSLNRQNRQAAVPASGRGAADDVALILYSGGTTGIQKGVCLTNRNMNSYAVLSHEVAGNTRNARSLAVLPLFHGFGLGSGIHNMLTCCSHVFLLPSYDPVKCNRLIFKKRIEVIFAIPAMYEALVHSDEIRTEDCGFFKFLYCGGDKLKEKTERAFNAIMEKRGFSARIIQGYGLTECVAGCTSNALFRVKEGTTGMSFPDTELKIVSTKTGEELPAGETGELCVCGPTVMKGYFKNEEASAQALRVHPDGRTWLHTGDLFSVDRDGFYTFHSRRSRMLVVNGFNVYPEMVENAMLQIPGVDRCCVVGTSARIGGDRIAAAVQLKEDGREHTPASILQACRSLLPGYAVPYKVVIMDALPLTRLGKVDYRRVAGQMEKE